MRFDNTEVFNIEGALRGMRFPMKGVGDTLENVIGDKDMVVAQKLYRASELDNFAHSKFLRQIGVSVDISAPLYFWSEFDTYKVGTTANSESTMHGLIKDAKNLSLSDFEVDANKQDYFAKHVIPMLQDIAENAHYDGISRLRALKQCLPTAYIQKRHWTGNYEVIRNMYRQRYNHRLTEWSVIFAKWAKSLPYGEEFLTRRILRGIKDG